MIIFEASLNWKYENDIQKLEKCVKLKSIKQD